MGPDVIGAVLSTLVGPLLKLKNSASSYSYYCYSFSDNLYVTPNKLFGSLLALYSKLSYIYSYILILLT